jgi:putative membrane-bound dehydrogenase-like protein
MTGFSRRNLAGTDYCWTALLWFVAFGSVFGQTLQLTNHPIASSENCHVHPAVEISLFAKEPDVVDPVALTFDEAGRMYVVEMRDYPYGFGPQRKPGGTVRLLEDTNHDGRADRSVLFADNLSFPTSICPWNGGVLVTCPPEIIFLKDTDGDGRADVREVLFSGFTLGVTDSNVNGLRWGLDNRVHGLNGGNGGSVRSLRKPGAPVNLGDLDFSFDPATGDFTTTFRASGGFGLVFDDWGRSFVTYNIDHIQHRFIADRYLRRFPGFPPIAATCSISDHGDMARIYPISVAQTRPNHPEQSGYFSSAGGMGYVGWSGFGPDLEGNVMVCDVVGNLVHRDVIREAGPVFSAVRASSEQTEEFFASRDNAFRPVGLEAGPDGALYLIDMQRDVIEHPDYIPEKVRSKLDLRAGDDRGRIYRLTPKGMPLTNRSVLATASPAALVENLSHPLPWRRMTAQRLLVERQSTEAIEPLKRLVRSGKEAKGRLHALWTLSGLKALEADLVEQALNDPNPGVRENGLLLAETLLPQSATLRQQILALASDKSARVRFQTALTIGQVASPDPRPALLAILKQDYAERWTRLAVLSSLRSGVAEALNVLPLETRTVTNDVPALEAVREVADLAVARDGAMGLSALIQCLARPSWTETFQLAALEGISSGLGRRGDAIKPDAPATAILEKLLGSASPQLLAASWRVARALELPENLAQRNALDRALRDARDENRPEAERVADIRLLALGKYDSVKNVLFQLLEGNQPAAIQQAAVQSLAEFSQPDIGKNLVQHWRELGPSIRPAALGLLLRRQAYHTYLVSAWENGQLTVGELNLDLEQRRRLLNRSTPEIQKRAAAFIQDGEYSNRKTIVEEWLAKLPASGEPQAGKVVFEKTCAQCHRVGSLGSRVGPELTGMSHRSVEDLLSNILDPNMAINPAYITYNCETVSGDLESGLLKAESADAITLLQASEKKVVIPRKNIKRLQSSGLSLMPEGLESGLSPVDLRNLIAFLQENKPASK